jgi:protein O-mannosyl-transferase
MTDRLRRWAPFSVVLLAIASSAVGVVNWFTYDDKYIVELNPIMRDFSHFWRVFASSYWPKDWGGDGYRPLTLLAFQIETKLGHGIPLPFHITNILLYAAVSFLVYRLARRMMPEWAAWLVAALFAVHPVHVEAVANIVGQSELWVALAVIPAISIYLRDRARGELPLRSVGIIALLYLVACLFKEHGIVLPAILAAAELTVISDSRTIRERLSSPNFRLTYWVLALTGIAFIAVRAIVLSDHGLGGFQPFTPFSALKIGQADRMLTAVGVVPQWLRLFYWPARLVSEYGPPEIEVAQGFDISLLPGFLLLFATIALAFILRRRAPLISFGIAFAAAALLPSSNFIVPAGIVLAERTLFLPSVGAMLVLGGVALEAAKWFGASNHLTRQSIYAAAGACTVVLLAGVVHSYNRTKVWRNNETLFQNAVMDAPDSYRAHYMLGAWSFDQKRQRVGEAEYKKAMALFPYDPNVAYSLAEQYRRKALCRPAVPLYRWSRAIDPEFPFGRIAEASCLLELGDFAAAKAASYEAVRFGGDLKITRRIRFIADSALAADTRVGTHQSPGLAGVVMGDDVHGKVPEVPQKTPGSAPKGPGF